MKTSKLIILVILAVVIFITKCTKDESIQGNKLDLEKLAVKIKPSNTSKSQPMALLVTDEIPLTRDNLTSMKTIVKIFSGTKSAGLTIPGFGGLTLGAGESNLNAYYIETKIVKRQTDTVVYAIGYSIHYLFKKVKKGLDITKLPFISASVQLESSQTQVLYSIQTYGIRGINLVQYFKPNINKNFDVEGYGVIQSSIDGIQNVLGDTVLSKSVKFTQEILEFVKPSDLH
jgi:hypothetical protein